MICILFALTEEMEPFANKIGVLSEQQVVGHFRYLTAATAAQRLVLTVTGMGKVSAAMATQAVIDRFRPDLIIQAGVAGSLRTDMRAGDVFVASEICQHDVHMAGTADKWQSCSHQGQVIYKPNRDALGIALQVPWPGNSARFSGRLLTGDKAVATAKYADKLRRELSGDAVDMESGAVAQVACVNNVPFCVLRTISDNADEHAMTHFHNNFPHACAVLGEYLYVLFGKLVNEFLLRSE